LLDFDLIDNNIWFWCR